MNRFRVYPYKMGSRSATSLSEGLREGGDSCFKVYPDRKYTPSASHTIINWGMGRVPNWVHGDNNQMINFINNPKNVSKAGNKLSAFRIMLGGGVSIPEFTNSKAVAYGWLESDITVVAREKLRGYGGAGIVMMKTPEDHRWDDYPLYVKYIKKNDEYRVHVFNGKVIGVQMKKKKRATPNEEVDYQVRNLQSGWVYCRDGITPDPSILSNAILSVASLGLDFGAVDVIWNEYEGKAYVLEVNTAPGLTGTTLTNYINAFKESVGGL